MNNKHEYDSSTKDIDDSESFIISTYSLSISINQILWLADK